MSRRDIISDPHSARARVAVSCRALGIPDDTASLRRDQAR
jgi:hypothetical protein